MTRIALASEEAVVMPQQVNLKEKRSWQASKA